MVVAHSRTALFGSWADADARVDGVLGRGEPIGAWSRIRFSRNDDDEGAAGQLSREGVHNRPVIGAYDDGGLNNHCGLAADVVRPAIADDRVRTAFGESGPGMAAGLVVRALQSADPRCARELRRLAAMMQTIERGDVAMNLIGLILLAALSGGIVAVSLRLRLRASVSSDRLLSDGD